MPGLERAIAKSKGVEFGSLLHQFGADFSANPYSPCNSRHPAGNQSGRAKPAAEAASGASIAQKGRRSARRSAGFRRQNVPPPNQNKAAKKRQGAKKRRLPKSQHPNPPPRKQKRNPLPRPKCPPNRLKNSLLARPLCRKRNRSPKDSPNANRDKKMGRRLSAHLLVPIIIDCDYVSPWRLSCRCKRAVDNRKTKSPRKTKRSQPGPLILDDAPLPLSANPALDETDRDKVEALALFSAARSLELREQVWRSIAIISARIPMRSSIGRNHPGDCAAGHSLKTRKRRGSLCPEVGRVWKKILIPYCCGVWESDWKKKAIGPRPLNFSSGRWPCRAGDEPKSSDDVLLRMDTGRLLMLVGKYKEAADCFALVVDALEHPDKYALSEEIQKVFAG